MDFDELLQWLCCPRCRGALRTAANPPDQLTCQLCGDGYPVVDGIPVLLPDASRHQIRYWDPQDKASLYDQKVEGGDDPFGQYNHRSEVLAITSLYRTENLAMVLDAGCGNGRILTTLPATAMTIGADASLNLLRLAKERGRGHWHVCCELENLPFRSDLFTTVICCRVLQHIRDQERAVAELARVTRTGGDLIVEVYNAWNLKTLYKWIRQSRIRYCFNWPFRMLFRSMSPFAPWGLDYDRYHGWLEIQRRLQRHGLGSLTGRGAGFGFHKYFLIPFYWDAWLKRHAPVRLQQYYDGCFQLEKAIAPRWPFRMLMEKFALRGVKTRSGYFPDRTDILVKSIRHLWHASWLFTARARLETWREQLVVGISAIDHQPCLQEAVSWIKRAQDSTGDGGVARGYSLGWSPQFQRQGWQPAYPETTGYLIPTCFDAAKYLSDPELGQRAVAMAEWEIRVQLPGGAVQGGVIGQQATPAVFNTGQVILGWLRAWQETGETHFLEAAIRGGDFLVRVQGGDGAFTMGNSCYADQVATTYNARVGWALILLGQATQRRSYLVAGIQSIDAALRQQTGNGWFRANCLSQPETPLLHTICYAVEGILGAALALERPDYLAAARLTAQRLLDRLGGDGRIAGRLDADWQPVVPWDCLTGSAQLAGIWLQLWHLTGEKEYQQGARRILAFLKSIQNRESRNNGLRGGIKGSFPFDGDYGRYEILNWPTKFFIDALLLDEYGKIPQ